MRPISLTMTAFGPFAGTETVNFEEFGAAPLFLINGPTGSGKTTILDAMCFALYGQTTGGDRDGSQMRCGFAEADVLTEVVLTFDLAGKHYRVRRVPAQTRPTVKGTRTTEQSTEAQLWLINNDDADQLIVERKVTDANAEIENIIGLNADQFRQVMVLPQGKFRQLLMADSKDREHIFGQLFQTQVYKQLEENLKTKALEISREVNKLLQVQMGILESAGLENQQALVDELSLMQPKQDELLKVKNHQNNQLRASVTKLHDAKTLFDGFQAFAISTTNKQQLANKQSVVDAQRNQVLKAQQAQKIKPVFDLLEQHQQALKEANEKCVTNTQHQNECKHAFNMANENNALAKDKGPALDAAKQKLNTLHSYRERVEQLDRVQAVLGDIKIAQGVAKEGVTLAEKAVKTIASDREKVEGQQQGIQSALSTLSEKKLALKKLDDQLVEKKHLQALQSQVQQTQGALEQKQQQRLQLSHAHDITQTTTKHLELAWHQGQAAILAQDLGTGQPCPVCGSDEHPSPAHSDHKLPTQAELDQAKGEQQQALNKLTSAGESYASINSQLEGLQAQCNQATTKLGVAVNVPLAQLQQQHSTLADSVAKLDDQKQQLTTLEKRISTLKINEEEHRNQLETATQKHSTALAKLATANSEVLSAEQELPTLYRQAGALQTAEIDQQASISALDQQINQAQEAYNQASAAWENAKAMEQASLEHQRMTDQKVLQADGNAVVALQSSCFGTAQEYEDAQLTDADLNVIQQAISTYDIDRHRISGVFEQQQQALEGKVKPDVQVFEAAHKLTTQASGAADHEWAEADKRLSSLLNTQNKLQQAQHNQDGLNEEYAVIGTLSQVANGQTGDKVSLQRFVLSVLLDDVLLEASQRLSIMSKGRYQLIRKEDRSKGNKASGLELEVEDSHTGKARPVATLSGGESFMAALAMALGLSEVVQAYAGGIRLDTLFIDEGFGSLDTESLDLAVQTLIDLQASGRMVGVISHVSELKEQISQRIDVVTGRDGSKVEMVTA
jgi:exonuclease SbcC